MVPELLVVLAFAVLPAGGPLAAQTGADDATPGAQVGAEPDGEVARRAQRREASLESLGTLLRSREAKEEALAGLMEQLTAATSEVEREELRQEIKALQAEIDRVAADFEAIATGIDLGEFQLTESQSFDLQDEVLKLIQPLVEELKDATEAPRQIERLRGQLDYLGGREQMASGALASVDALLDSLTPEDPASIRAALEGSKASWEQRLEEVRGQATVTRYQLERLLSQRTSIVQSTQSALGDFFRTRGLNLLLALATFFLVLVVLRAAHTRITKLLPHAKGDERPFYSRLVEVLYFSFVGLFATLASLLVLYATGDWVLLGLSLLFLLGVAWAFKATIPMFLEQIRLLLNLGTVRERERVLIDGVPYRVLKLSFHTLLANPELAGGVRRLPLADLVDMRSRTCSKDEIWFPCSRGDWVLLSDGVRGEVMHQSPDTVQLRQLGGARATYPTGDFLALAPRNLSEGFRQQVRFGIDYDLQATATGEVPRVFEERVQAGLAREFDPEALRRVRVEFCEAGASSLDYLVLVDCDGSLAPRYEAIGRAVQRLCVDTCNEMGWGIPFTQVTLHQAEPAAAGA